MQMKWILVPVAAAAVGIGAFSLSSTPVSAHGMGMGSNDTMITRFAQAFGKSEDEVRSVMEKIHAEHEANRMADLTAKLDAGVSAGQITSAQKQLILDKFASIKDEHEAQRATWKESGEKPAPGQRRENHQDRKAELEKWATDNGIPTAFLSTLFGRPTNQQ